MIEGLNDIDGGEALIDGISVRTNPYRVKERIGVQLQANEYFDNVSLEELLSLFGALYHRTIDPMALLAKVQLEDKAKQNLQPCRAVRNSASQSPVRW